jgi:hypothetical protein
VAYFWQCVFTAQRWSIKLFDNFSEWSLCMTLQKAHKGTTNYATNKPMKKPARLCGSVASSCSCRYAQDVNLLYLILLSLPSFIFWRTLFSYRSLKFAFTELFEGIYQMLLNQIRVTPTSMSCHRNSRRFLGPKNWLYFGRYVGVLINRTI